MKSFLRVPAILLVILCSACESPPRDAVDDKTTVNAAIGKAEIVDVAVLPPNVASPDSAPIEARIRATAHEFLIAAKNYAVPDDAFVDRVLGGAKGGDATVAAATTGSDAALVVQLTAWETGDLLPKGRIYASGRVTLYGNGEIWWERTFSNRMLIANTNVTAVNRDEVTDAMVRNLTRDLLSTLPPKPAR